MSLAFSQELGRAGLQPRRQSGQMKGALAPEAAGCNRTSIIRSILPNSAVNITLRNFKPDDFDTLHEIDQACYEPEVAYSQRELRAYLRFSGSDCLVAEAEGESSGATEKQIAGFCISARRDESGYIVTIDVLPEFRRHHVGSILLAEIERRLAANGVHEVALET